MNYNWTNNAYWLLRLRLKPGWAEVRSVSRRLPGCLPVLRSVEPPAAGFLSCMGGAAGTAGTAVAVPLLREVRKAKQSFAVPYYSFKMSDISVIYSS